MIRFSCIPEHNSLQLLKMKKYSGCMCTFANEIKTLNLFEYEQMQVSKYSLFELSTYIDVHLSHIISTPVFVALQPIKFKLVAQLQSLAELLKFRTWQV